jgi:hypothetical protein
MIKTTRDAIVAIEASRYPPITCNLLCSCPRKARTAGDIIYATEGLENGSLLPVRVNNIDEVEKEARTRYLWT